MAERRIPKKQEQEVKRKIERKPVKLRTEAMDQKAKAHIENIQHENSLRAKHVAPQTPFVNYSGKTHYAFSVGKIEVNYRLRDNSQVEQRRYLLGCVQVAYVRIEAGQYHCIICDGFETSSLVGTMFKKEADLHEHIKSRLLAHPDSLKPKK